MSAPISQPVPLDLRALLQAFGTELFQKLNCVEVGSIAAFDSAKQTASVQIGVLRRIVDGGVVKDVPYPVLTDCPVLFLVGGAASLRLPVAVGDTCVVLFNDRNLDNWYSTGNVVAPNTSRTHDLSDGLVIVGFRNLSNPLQNWLAGAAELVNGDYKLSIQQDGTVQLVGKSGTILQVKNDGTFSLTMTGGVTVNSTTGGKVNIANGSTSLMAGLNQLFTALTGWVDTGGQTPNPATVTALNNAKTTLQGLLT